MNLPKLHNDYFYTYNYNMSSGEGFGVCSLKYNSRLCLTHNPLEEVIHDRFFQLMKLLLEGANDAHEYRFTKRYFGRSDEYNLSILIWPWIPVRPYKYKTIIRTFECFYMEKKTCFQLFHFLLDPEGYVATGQEK